jgi:hypothetical protein
LAAAGIHDIVFAKANDAAPPHAGRAIGSGLHDVDQRMAIRAQLLVRDLVEEIRY